MIPSCVVSLAQTRAICTRQDLGQGEKLNAFPSLLLAISREELVKEQNADPSLITLFDLVCSADEWRTLPQGYFLQSDLLVRKWTPHVELENSPIGQVVVPFKFHELVLRVSHDQLVILGCGKRMTYSSAFFPALF